MSPARALAPAIVFHCHWNTVWVYVLGGELKCPVPNLLCNHHLDGGPDPAVLVGATSFKAIERLQECFSVWNWSKFLPAARMEI